MKKTKLIITLKVTFYMLLFTFNSSAQNVGINTTGATPDASALLDLSSTEKGFLITRVDTSNITSPAFGLMTLAPADSCLYMYSGATWISIGGGGHNCACGESSTPSDLACGDDITDARDNKVYGTVGIGSQCWMKENLNYSPTLGTSWCHDNVNANCDTYGRLYDWTAAMAGASSSNSNPSGIQGACPTGWHLPSDSEWKELEIELGMDPAIANGLGWRGVDQGAQLKTSSWNGTNLSGFTALPGGFRNTLGMSGLMGEYGYWWSATEYYTTSDAIRRGLSASQNKVNYTVADKVSGLSVRCVRD